MRNDHHIEPAGSQFTVIDPAGGQVGTYPTEEAAWQEVESRRKQDAMLETAKLLLHIAVKAHMHVHDVDREKAWYWIRSAMDVVD